MEPSIDPDDLNLERNRVSCIGRALIRTRGQQTTAAPLLGLTTRMMNYVITHHGLRPLVEIGALAATNEDAARAALAAFVRAYVPVRDAAPTKQPNEPRRTRDEDRPRGGKYGR